MRQVVGLFITFVCASFFSDVSPEITTERFRLISSRLIGCFPYGYGGCVDLEGGCFRSLNGSGRCLNIGTRINPDCRCVFSMFF